MKRSVPAVPQDQYPRGALIFFISLLALAGIFLVLTNGIPVLELFGFEGDLPKKSRFTLMTRLGALFVAVAAVLYHFSTRNRALPEPQPRLIIFLQKHAIFFSAGIAIVYFALTAAVGFARHAALETRAFDLGIFSQAVWMTTQGEFLYSSLKDGICLLGDHVSPVLAVLAPFYNAIPDPRILFIFQSAASAANIVLVAVIAFQKTRSRNAAIVFALCAFFYYPARAALHEDFHPEVLVEPFIFLAFLCAEKGRWISFLFCLPVIASGKENMFGVTFILGLYTFLFKKKRFLGVSVMAASVMFFLAAISWLVPALSGQEYFYQKSYKSLLNPQLAMFSLLADGERWEYLLKVFLPFLFLPFFHLPTLLLAAPILFQNFLSHNGVMRSFNFHYFTGMTPGLFIAAVYGYQRLMERHAWMAHKKGWILGALLLTGVLRSGPSELYYFWTATKNTTGHKAMIREILMNIPPSKTVLTHNNLIPQLANRKHVYQFDYNDTETKLARALRTKADYVIMETGFWEGHQPVAEVLNDLTSHGYSLESSQNGFMILKKNADARQV